MYSLSSYQFCILIVVMFACYITSHVWLVVLLTFAFSFSRHVLHIISHVKLVVLLTFHYLCAFNQVVTLVMCWYEYFDTPTFAFNLVVTLVMCRFEYFVIKIGDFCIWLSCRLTCVGKVLNNLLCRPSVWLWWHNIWLNGLVIFI